MDAPIPAPPATPPSPAAPIATPEPIPAVQAAFDKEDVGGFLAAKRAERAGTPLPPAQVEAKATEDQLRADAAAKESALLPPAPKKITLTQDELNARTRRAVEEALRSAEQARTTAAPEPKAPAPPPAEKFPSIDDWSVKNPTGSFTDYLDARDTFRDEQRATAARSAAESQGRLTELKTRADQFRDRMTAAITADADFASKVPADVFAAKPLSGFSREDIQAGKVTFANIAAEAAFRSGDPATFLQHLHTHADEAHRIAVLPPSEWLIELIALDRSLAKTSSPATPPVVEPVASSSPITAAPPPPPTLTKPSGTVDPKADALKRGDFGTFHEIQRSERLARINGAA